MKALEWAAAVAAAVTLASCADYLDRRESISFGAGDAQQANLITHVVSPLPSHAADRDLVFHGERMAGAVERYRTGESAEPAEARGRATGSAPASGSQGGTAR